MVGALQRLPHTPNVLTFVALAVGICPIPLCAAYCPRHGIGKVARLLVLSDDPTTVTRLRYFLPSELRSFGFSRRWCLIDNSRKCPPCVTCIAPRCRRCRRYLYSSGVACPCQFNDVARGRVLFNYVYFLNCFIFPLITIHRGYINGQPVLFGRAVEKIPIYITIPPREVPRLGDFRAICCFM